VNTFEIIVIASLLFSVFAMLYIGFWFGENSENKRVCSAWYEKLNLHTNYSAIVYDNGTVLNFSKITYDIWNTSP